MNTLREFSNTRIQKIHFVGIGGSGMSGIAEVLHNLGYQISGSDTCKSATTKRLSEMGCEVFYQHLSNQVDNTQAVIISSAIGQNNPEVVRAHELNIPVVPRAEMLAEIMRFRFGIAVAGTHGKTTTTSLITHILNTAKLDPTYIIGGILNSSGINAKLGESDYLVAEADESDGSFLHLQPMLSVITNIDQDHMATYDNDYQKLEDAFISFTGNLPFYGACIVCADDKGVANILPKVHRPLITYGLNSKADVCATSITQSGRKMFFKAVCNQYNTTFDVELNLIGRHNILNTLAAIGTACELGIKVETIQQALKSFSGVARRLDYHGNIKINHNTVSLFDDYGHHPNEILAVLDSLRQTYTNRRLVLIFQPHRYSRTRDLFDDFSKALSLADQLILLDIYPASETPIANINTTTLANSIRQRSTLDPIVVKDPNEALQTLPNIIKDNDVVLTLGAGDIHHLVGLITHQYVAS